VNARVLGGALAAALAVAAAPRAAQACAGCRNPNLPITRLATAPLASGEVRASAAASGTALNVVHQAGCAVPADCHDLPVQPLHLHDQDIYPGELRATVEVGLGSAWGLEAHLPLRLTHTRIRYRTPDGAPYQPLDPGVHHRNETLVGAGDPWLLARTGLTLGAFQLTGRLGVSLPVGRIEENPFALGMMGKRHQHIQLGTGTFDPVLGLDLSRTVAAIELSLYGQAQLAVYQGRRGYQAGNRYFFGAQAGRRVVGRLVAGLGLDLLHEGAERWDGAIQQDGNLGRSELLAGLSLTHPVGQTLITLTARFPLARWIVTGDQAQGRLSSPLMLSLNVSHTFGRSAPVIH
jgi:hypothetical protein